MPYAVRVRQAVETRQGKDKVHYDIMYVHAMMLQCYYFFFNSFKHKKLNPLKAQNRNSSVK